VAKLKKYADKTFVDGLIYVCDSDRLSETIRLIYRNKIVANSLRVRQYGENFFLFSDSISAYDEPLKNVYNSNKKLTSVDNWIDYLRNTKRNFRRDSEISLLGPTTPAERN
jgi:hypothetical protein